MSSLTHNINHVHIDEEVVETTLAISSFRSGKNLPDPYKDHPIHQGLIEEEEAPAIIEQHSSKDEEEQATSKPNPDNYKPPMPYPQTIKCPQAKNSETNDHVLDAF